MEQNPIEEQLVKAKMAFHELSERFGQYHPQTIDDMLEDAVPAEIIEEVTDTLTMAISSYMKHQILETDADLTKSIALLQAVEDHIKKYIH